MARFFNFRKIIFFFTVFGFWNSVLAQRKKPNIIFILTDDQGYGDVGVFAQNQRAREGKPYERSPNLDQLAAAGAVFTQQYASAPVCAPSRASLMLGVSQGHANVRDNQFDRAIDENYTMASTLRTLGYTTVAVGKWGLQGANKWDQNGKAWPAKPRNRGFDDFFGYMRHVDGHEHYPKESLYFKGHKQIEVWDNGENITPVLDKCYTPDLWTAYAKKWITDYKRSSKKDQPFFMYLAFETPHAVLELPTQAYPKGGGLKGGMQWLGKARHMITTATGRPDTYINPDYANATYDDDNDPSTKEVAWPDTYKRYATATRRIDYCVGDLVTLLKDLKIDDNTIIVYTSDNGPSIESYLPQGYVPNHPTFFGSYGPFDGIKRDDWEGGVRMPVIASWPGHIQAGTVITQPSIAFDWAATFIDAAGAAAPERMDGVSLMPVLTGKGVQRRGLIYNEYYEHGKTPDFKEFATGHRGRVRDQMQMTRIDSFVGVRYNIKSAEDDFEIYNVVSDPQQTHNLALNQALTIRLAQSDDARPIIHTIKDLQTYFKNRVLQVRRPEKWAPRPYDSALVPAVDVSNIRSGLNWKAYKGNFKWIPQVEGLTPYQHGKVSVPAFSSIKDKTGAGDLVVFEGYIKVPADGQYDFYLTAGSSAFLRIHDMQLIDADFGYKPGTEKQASVFLKAGLHPFRLLCYRKGDNQPSISFKWNGPGIQKQSIDAKAFFSN